MLGFLECTELHLRNMIMVNSTEVQVMDLWRCYNRSQAPTTSTTIILAIVFGFGVIGVSLLIRWRLQQQHHQQQQQQEKNTKNPMTKQQHNNMRRTKKLQRSVSYTSSMLASCPIPARVNLPDPTINVFIEFQEQCPTEQDVMDHLVMKLLNYDRLAKIPVLGKDHQLRFEESELGAYDPRQLLRRIPLESSDDDVQLYKAIERHLHDPLNNAPEVEIRGGRLPWWEILLLENKGAGSSACLVRIHHALGDGISLATVAQQILEYADGTPFTSVVPEGLMEKRAAAPHTKLPWYSLAWKLWEAAVTVFTMPTVTPDHDTIFSKGVNQNVVHSHNREIVLFPTLPLDFVKAIKNAANVSINDVLFTCLSQAIRDYLEELECPILREQGADLLCRALIAAVLPRAPHTSTADILQNKWFFLSSDLGVGISPDNNDILERLQYLHDHLGSLKTSPVPMIGLWIQNYVMRYIAPRWFTSWAMFNSLARRSLSISNVPGPPKICLVAKQRASCVNMFLSSVMPHVTFLSYAGKIFGNVTVDPEAIPNPQSLARHLQTMYQLDYTVASTLRFMIDFDRSSSCCDRIETRWI